MENYWQKQIPEEPLFPDLLWSRPENKQAAGKLLIIGGSSHGFSSIAQAYSESIKAGIGVVKVVMPDAVKSAVKTFLPECEFAPSTPSGSFARSSLTELIELSKWADGVLLAGEFGHNSETAIVLESFLEKADRPLVLTKDSIDYFYSTPLPLLNNNRVCVVVDMGQLQKLGIKAGFARPITLGMDLIRLTEALHEVTQAHPSHIITKHLEQTVIASGGKVSTTKSSQDDSAWGVKSAAYAAVWLLQNPTKAFAALTTAVFNLNQD